MSHAPNDRITGDNSQSQYEIIRYFNRGSLVERFENKTLEKKLLEKIYASARYNAHTFGDLKETDPEKILDSIIEEINPGELGFTDSRIEEFKTVAKELKDKIILEGSKKLVEESIELIQ